MGLVITIPGVSFTNGIAPLRSDVVAYRNAHQTAESALSSEKVVALNAFINTIDAAGVLIKIDQLYLFDGSNLAGKLLRFKGGGAMTVTGTPDPIVSASGLTLDGNEGVLTTGYTMSATGAISWYCGNNGQAGTAVPVSGGPTHEIAVVGNVQVGYGNSANLISYADSNKQALWTVTRDSNTSLKLYKNAVQVAENTTNVTPAAAGNATLVGNRPGLASAQVPHLTRFVALWNASATAANVTALNTALNAYLAVT